MTDVKNLVNSWKCNDPATVYTADNSLRLHPAQVKLIQVSWNAARPRLYITHIACIISLCENLHMLSRFYL